VPLLQPLALSAGTRRAIKGQDGLLKRTRAAAIAACGDDADQDLARLQRVRPRTLLVIAALAGAFYFLLPQIAQVSSSWQALQHVNWAWLPVIIGLSALTYVASAAALIGSVPAHVPFGPAVLAQGASSFINRVSPANVGGMALNARFLQKSGTSTPASVAAVGVNALAGAVMHLVLIVVFFTLAGHDLSKAFKLPSGSKILLILAVIIAVIGVILATRPGRRWTRKQLIPGARSAAGSLRQAAASPVKLGLLLGGSALITLAYIAGLAASIQAFGPGPGLAVIGAVYLGASALAAAAPTPGGLGAIEAALVAGLTGVGMQAGPAVSAVLLYRLSTYWLPVLPGWLCWRFLQHREYV
jgi:undecaprenyl-diphosphatase